MTTSLPPLQSLLEQEGTVMGQFIQLLQTEQLALKDGKTDELEALDAQKAALVAKLNEQGELRNQFLRGAKLAPDREGVEAWIQANPKDFAVRQQWGRLKSAVVEARELNLLNGKLIAMRLQHNQQLLGALLSSSGTPQTNLYGPNGQPAQLSGRRIIDAA